MCTHYCTAPQRLFARTFDAAGVLACDIDDGILFMQVGQFGVQDLSKGNWKERSVTQTPFKAQFAKSTAYSILSYRSKKILCHLLTPLDLCFITPAAGAN